ncbi:MAG: hypothetical protein AAFW69_10020, partial [Pseudomonadota bacterium]
PIQRGLNTVLGASRGLLSDPICKALPDLRSEGILPSREASEAYLAALAPDLDVISAHLPEGEALSTEIPDPTPEQLGDAARITHEQANTVGRVLGQAVLVERTKALDARIGQLDAEIKLHGLEGDEGAQHRARKLRRKLAQQRRELLR